MKKVGNRWSLALVALIIACVAVSVSVSVAEGNGAGCDPVALSPCLPAITGSDSPTEECCRLLRSQEPCFCSYLSNPAFKPYIDSPNARAVATKCGVQIPTKC
ncbi:non-specific lipid-transfer protein 2-like [Andrographis paniculata]|uniref:non-specific lipid-transfer protein 2-like n=1 Tax=Andrographis paniculata TaxID=175694 RepID=UPI0021E806B2|nr:non-specific lipid-transfer protein 2-like [Andrographis paniculata]